MRLQYSALALGVRAGLLIMLVLPAVHGQAVSSRDYSSADAAPTAGAATVPLGAQALYRKHCMKCHGADGKGTAAKGLFDEIPDFTSRPWHARHSDGQLLASILDGKGTGMPSLSGKLTKSQARDLVRYVRAFAPALKKAPPEKKERSTRNSFEDRYRALQKELSELREQFRQLSASKYDSTK